MLEAFLSGGYWLEERCQSAGLLDSPECKRCGHHKGDALHVLWACPRNSDIDELEVMSSQVLASDAVAGADNVACLWLRGLVPRSLTAVTSPCPGRREITYFGGVPCGPWPGGVYWTDGSGGKYGGVRALRRCGSGVSVVALGEGGRVEFVWGAFAPLRGELQIVPRAELNACIMVLAKVSFGVG